MTAYVLTRKLQSSFNDEDSMRTLLRNHALREPTEPRDRQEDIERRLVRIETRLTKLLHHFGLRADGSPYRATVPSPSTNRDE